jgi:hypothetical protein
MRVLPPSERAGRLVMDMARRRRHTHERVAGGYRDRSTLRAGKDIGDGTDD